MRTRNPNRDSKVKEIDLIAKDYENDGLTRIEVENAIILELEKKVERTGDARERGSPNEYGRRFFPVYVQNGRLTGHGKCLMNRDLSAIRQVNALKHPLENIYSLSLVEYNAKGNEEIRNYVAIIKGKKEVEFVNRRHTRTELALSRIKARIEMANNVQAVKEEEERHLIELRDKLRGRRRGKGAGST